MALDNFRKTSMRIDKANQRFLDYQNAKAGDINGRELLVQITNNGVVEDQTGTTLKLNWQHENGNQGSTNFNVVDIKTGKYSLYYPSKMLYKGTVDASVEINSNGRITNTMNFKIIVHADVFNGEAGTVNGVFISLADVNKKLDDREKEYVDLKDRQTSVETQFNSIQQEITEKDIISAPEIIAARGGLPQLEDRLNKTDAQLAQTKSFHTSNFIGKLKNGEEATVVFLGDSTTEQNATTNGEPNHVGLLTGWLKEKYGDLVTVVNAGISGNSISQMLARLSKDVLTKNPDLVIVCSAINDSFGSNQITLGEYRKDYNQVIQRLLAYSNPDIIIRTPNRVINPTSNAEMEPFIEVSRGIATRYSLGLFDLYKQMETDIANGTISLTVPAFMNDGIHPNENGHQYIYENFKSFFEQKNGAIIPQSDYRIVSGLGGFKVNNTAAVESVNANSLTGKILSFSVTGRFIETDFVGSEFSVVFGGSTGTGQFVVYIDGVAQPIVDTYRAVTAYGQYATYKVANGRHNIKIENQASKNANSNGNLLLIEGIVFKQEPLMNDVIKSYGYALVNQTNTINLTPSTNQYFIYNSVTDNSDIIDHNLSTGDVTVKQTGLYDLLYTNRITADPESNVVVGYTKNGVAQKQAYDFFPSGTGRRLKTVDLLETLELVAGDVIRFFVNVGGTTPTTISNVKISIKK